MASGMTKTQLTRHLAEKLGSNNKAAATFLEHLADTAIKETKKNGVFVVPGLGRLVKAHRKARMGRNPQTGEPIQIKAKTVVKFRVAKAAKDRKEMAGLAPAFSFCATAVGGAPSGQPARAPALLGVFFEQRWRFLQ